MKIIATSDWHLGNLFHGNDRLPEHRHFLGWLLDRIEEHRPDALLVAGDIFDNGNPSAASQAAYYEFLADATRRHPDLTIVITAGNHDSANRLEAPRALLSRHRVEIRGSVRRSWVAAAEGARWETDLDDLMIPLEGAEGDRAVVLAVPYLRLDTVHDACYSAGVNRLLRELTARARVRYPDIPLVMMAHMYAKGADIAPKDASEKIVIGGQEEVVMEGWPDHPDYLTCGHIHKRQHIWNTDWARYTGSVLPMSFAETDYTHGVDLITLAPGHRPKTELIEYTPQHRLRVLPADESLLTPRQMIRIVKKELPPLPADGKPGDDFEYVVLKVRLDKISNDELAELEAAVREKNAVLCRIQKVIPAVDLSTIRSHDRIESVDDILDRDPLETLREAFAIKHGEQLTERQEEMLSEVLESLRSNLDS